MEDQVLIMAAIILAVIFVVVIKCECYFELLEDNTKLLERQLSDIEDKLAKVERRLRGEDDKI